MALRIQQEAAARAAREAQELRHGFARFAPVDIPGTSGFPREFPAQDKRILLWIRQDASRGGGGIVGLEHGGNPVKFASEPWQ